MIIGVGVGRFLILGGGVRVQNIGGEERGGGANFFVGCKLIGAPAPNQSVPNNYISHIEN